MSIKSFRDSLLYHENSPFATDAVIVAADDGLFGVLSISIKYVR